MTRLSKLGHNVLFVNPPTRYKALKNLFRPGHLSFKSLSGIRKENEALTIYSPINIFNFRPFSIINTWVHSQRIGSLLSAYEKRKTILWVYHFDFPDMENFIKKLEYDLLIYDVVDEYSAFPEYAKGKKVNKGIVAFIQNLDEVLKVRLNQSGFSGKKWVVKREEWLAEKSDLIFASAPGLVTKFKNMCLKIGKDTEEVYFLPNSGDFERFHKVEEYKKSVPEDLAGIPRPRILSTGALDSYKVNIGLIEMCAKAYPGFSFVLIGPERLSDPDLDLSSLKSLKNVFLLGLKPYEILPYYTASSDAFIIPYNLNEYTIGGCFPVKFHDALSSGLPVIVTNLPAYKPFSNVCYIAKSDEEFIRFVKTALMEDSKQKFIQRQAVAKKNTWDIKVETQLKLIGTFY